MIIFRNFFAELTKVIVFGRRDLFRFSRNLEYDRCLLEKEEHVVLKMAFF